MIPSAAQDSPRRRFRHWSRVILRQPEAVDAHRARCQAALAMPGNEPLQGALADAFSRWGEPMAADKAALLRMAQDRLPPHVLGWFAALVQAPALQRITPLATRWSVLSVPSADMSTRARRCSPDDSRALAAQVVAAMQTGDQAAQQAFLHHCVTCHDNLAFMLARRAWLKTGQPLPDEWLQTSQQLEQAGTQ